MVAGLDEYKQFFRTGRVLSLRVTRLRELMLEHPSTGLPYASNVRGVLERVLFVARQWRGAVM